MLRVQRWAPPEQVGTPALPTSALGPKWRLIWWHRLEMPARKLRWLPDQRYRIFSGFDAIFTPSQTVRNQLLRGPLPADQVMLTSRLRLSTVPPGCDHDALSTLQQALGSRPVWLAARAQLEELPTLLEAHRTALRMLHRMLLVVALDDPQSRARARNLIVASGLQCADWDAGEEMDDYTQILITDSTNLGLWYRLAPVSCDQRAARREAQHRVPAAAVVQALRARPE